MKARILRNSRSKGQVLVETALCLVLLFGLLSGLMLLALTIYEYHSISQSAREGTRWAAVRGSASCTTTHVDHCNASATDIANYVAGLGYSYITSSNVTVLWCLPLLAGRRAPARRQRPRILEIWFRCKLRTRPRWWLRC